MSPADENLDRIARENKSNYDEDIGFLLDEIAYREDKIEDLIIWLYDHTVNVPYWVEQLSNEFAVDFTKDIT